MRVTTELWVSAAIRRVFSAGGYAAITRRGAAEAGAIFITCRGRDGMLRLLGPAPQQSYDEARPQERMFQEVLQSTDEDRVQEKLEREMKFDPDLWVVELEVDQALLDEIVPLTP